MPAAEFRGQGPAVLDYRPMNLASIIDPHPDDAVAVISRGKTTTYGDLREQTGGLRGGLAGLGLDPGDRVGIVAANNWYFVVSYLAVLGAGYVAVPLNPTSPVPELQNAARRHRRARRHRWSVGAGHHRQPRPRRRAYPRAHHHEQRRGPRRSAPARRPPGRARGPRGGRRARCPGGARVHKRHRRVAQGRHAHPRQPPLQHRPVPGPARTGPSRRRRGVRRASALPHLRAQRRARAHVRGRRSRAAHRALRPAVGHRGHRQPRGHHRERGPGHVGRLGFTPRHAPDRALHRCASPPPAPPSSMCRSSGPSRSASA